MLRFLTRGPVAAVLTVFFSLTAGSFTPAQISSANPTAPQTVPAPPTLLAAFDLAAGTLQSLHVPAGNPTVATIDVVLRGSPFRIVLAQHEVRSPTFQLFERGPGGLVLQPRSPCVTYRGYVAGDPDSDVAATIDGGSVTMYVRLAGGSVWGVQPVHPVQPAAGPALHVVYHADDNMRPAWQCGVQAANMPVPVAVGEDILYLTDLAIEADFPFFQLNGSNSTNTQNDITTVVNAMNVIYERDVDIRFVVSQIIVNTSTDPYSSTNASTLLNQFANNWNATHGGVLRDTAHLFTGRSIQGATIGIATVGTVCNIGAAYGLSQSRYTSNLTLRTSLTAHEIGHNFGAGHCDSTPPCHIMCSGNGGCLTPTLFGTPAKNQIISYRQLSGSCLTAQSTAPVITSVSPVLVETVSPPQVTITGSGLTGATHVTVGSTQITNLQPVSDTQLRFYPPWGEPLGIETFSVTTPVGTSNSASLWFTNANPAQLVVPPAVIGGNSVDWRMGGVEFDFAFLVISLASTSSPWMGWNLVDNPIVFWSGGLDARGMASYSFFVPSMTFSGLRAYTQLLDITNGTVSVRSTSAIKSTLVIL
ncbi:MAG: IPT/TIG domain-containing protein [Planctomycetes bacterium]|nr:IPT/TIG domain-containing protein [Planctomycetota bacterium]